VASVAMTATDCRPHGCSPIPTNGEQGRAAIDQRPTIAAGRGRSAAVADVGVSGDDGVDLIPAIGSQGELGHDPVLANVAPGVTAPLTRSSLLHQQSHVFGVGGYLYIGYRG
jgi:hypothetical protein